MRNKRQTIGIVGLGLIGGSLAAALSPRCDVTGYDTDPATLAVCRANGTVHRVAADFTDFRGCEIIFVCVPLGRVADTVARLYDAVGEGAILTDVASVKRILCGQKGRIVGGHPMAGREQGGIAAAQAHLFENAYYCLVSYDGTAEADMLAVERLVKEGLRARPVRLSATQHDSAVAKVSHLPHAVAYALAYSALTDDGEAVAGSGFWDSTRIAGSDPLFWRTVCRLNRDNLLAEMDAFAQVFARLRQLIEQGDYDGVQALFASAKAKRDALVGHNE